MYVEMNAFGELNISSETDIELYALKKWFDDWQKGKSTLHVQGVIESVLPEHQCDFCHKKLFPGDEHIETLHIKKGAVYLCRECYNHAENDVR